MRRTRVHRSLAALFLFFCFAASNGDVQNLQPHHHPHKEGRTAAVHDQNDHDYYQDSNSHCCARFSLWACFGWNGEDEVKRFIGVSPCWQLPCARPSVLCTGFRVSVLRPPCWLSTPCPPFFS